MRQPDSLKAYRNITLLLLLALFMAVRMADYDERVVPCTPGSCAHPADTLFIVAQDNFPETGASRVLGFFAGQGIPVWLGWAGGLVVPVILLGIAIAMLPRPPWKE